MRATEADAPPADRDSARWFLRPAMTLVFLAVLGIAAYANSFSNRALFHHVPNAYADPVLDNTMLRSYALLPKIFTREFLLATCGEYRPLGYALFAAINGLVPRDAYVPWHILLLGIHLLSAFIVFATLRMLVRGVMAAGLAAAYLLHPIFVPLLNDVNTIYFLWGLLFTVATVWLFLAYLKRKGLLYLLLSIACFAASLFTYRHAVVTPVFLVALCLFQDRYPRGAVAMLAYASLAALLAGICRVHPLITLAGLSALVLIVSTALPIGRERYAALVKTLPPYLFLVVVFLLVSTAMKLPPPVFRLALAELQEGDLIAPFQPWFVSRQMLAGSTLQVISLVIAALMPAALLLQQRGRKATIAAAVPVLVLTTVLGNFGYRSDTVYWRSALTSCPDSPAVQLNLASAYVEHGQWESARDLLMHLRYEREVQGLLRDTANNMLGRAFAGMGNDKLAGFYLFPRGKGWRAKIMKNLLMDTAHFCFRVGYVSVAEHFWACALVIDPYDVRLYNNLGRALTYKNFFRAATKHFRHVLSLQPDNPTALYHLAFLARADGNDREYELHRLRWQAATDSKQEPDFQPFLDGFRFDREKMRRWFSGRPLSLLQQEDAYRILLHGEEYNFWEAPLEVGKYFVRRNDPRAAENYLSWAHELNPRSKGAVQLLAVVYRQLDRTGDAERFERMLEKMSDETQTD